MTDINGGSADSGARSQFNTANVTDDTVQVERHEAKPVEGVLIVDMTASREPTRAAFIEDFTKGSEEFETLVGKVSEIGNVALTLIVHNGDGVQNLGRFENPREMAEALSKIPCKQARTQISGSLDIVPPGSHFVIVNGDTTDGDSFEILVEKAQALNIPVIPLLEKTINGSGTTPEHIEALKSMGEASGVEGGPFDFHTRMSMLDFVAVSSAAVRGPEAVEALKATGEIPQEVWDAIPPAALESIAEAAPETVSALPVPYDAQASRIIVPTIKGSAGVALGDVGEGAKVNIRVKTPRLPAPVDGGQDGASILNSHGVVIGRVGKDADVTIEVEPLDENPALLQAPPVIDSSGQPRRLGRMAGAVFAGILGATAIAGTGGYFIRKEVLASESFETAQRLASNNITFDTNSTELTPQAKENLREMTNALKASGRPYCITVTGSASAPGTAAQNEALSIRRAQAVSSHLYFGLSVPGDRIRVNWTGADMRRGGPDVYDQSTTIDIDKKEECAPTPAVG